MLKFRWFYLLLFVNFLTSISLVLFVYLTWDNENMAYYVIPMYVGWMALMLGSLIPLLLVSIGHLRKAMILLKAGDAEGLRRGMKRMKLASIPYFIANFLYFAVLALLAVAVSRGFVIFTPIPLIFILVMIFTYIIMLFTSIYGFVYLALLKKNEGMKWFPFVIHFAMQLVFVLDIFDTVLLLSWYPNDEKHGWKRTLITFTAIAAILLLVGWLGWRDLTSPVVDANIEHYPSADVDFAKLSSGTMPAISDLPDGAVLQFVNRTYQMGFVDWQSTSLSACFEEQTYQKEKARLDTTYDFLAAPVAYDGGRFAITAATFSISDYTFQVIDPPGEFDDFPNTIAMVATSDLDRTIVYLYCNDISLYDMGEETGPDRMVEYVEEKYVHFWE